ncbi:MAG: hypothetical protein OXC92_02725 [Flavobacteriaceae bacterium]|nr:hypothetical protein [Flavobacteriaceae bacterium]MCY4299171.1 hypothetical protein [Flavobacteriaceae bacterium]
MKKFETPGYIEKSTLTASKLNRMQQFNRAISLSKLSNQNTDRRYKNPNPNAPSNNVKERS